MLVMLYVTKAEEKVELTNELLDRFIVVPEHKLLFCYIEKNACSAFNELFLAVRKQQWSISPYFHNTYKKHGLTKGDLEAMVADPTWHKAVFYREPLERFVSAFMSKCVKGHDGDHVQCEQAFGEPFPEFSNAISQIRDRDRLQGPGTATNSHFMHQHRFCGGLLETLQYYDTVELIDKLDLRDKVARMLRKVNIDPTSLKEFDVLFPSPNATVSSEKYSVARRHGHNTDARNKMIDLVGHDSSTPAVLLGHYAADNFLFGIRSPPWAAKAYEALPVDRQSATSSPN